MNHKLCLLLIICFGFCLSILMFTVLNQDIHEINVIDKYYGIENKTIVFKIITPTMEYYTSYYRYKEIGLGMNRVKIHDNIIYAVDYLYYRENQNRNITFGTIPI